MTRLKLSEVHDEDVLTPKRVAQARFISFAITERQFLDGSKDVTRPLG
jgi:hypothetical protein